MDQRRFALAKALRDICLKRLAPPPRSMAVFGSFAGGDLRAESDIDLLLVGNEIPKRPFTRAQWFNPARKHFVRDCRTSFPGFPMILSPVFLSEQGWLDAVGLRLSVSIQSWLLWDDGFLSQSLSESAEWIRSGKWRRVDAASGGWFWVPREESAA